MAFSKYKKVLYLFAILLLPGSVYLLLWTGDHNFKPLPKIGPKQAIENLDGTFDTLYHTIPYFEFTNQDGKKVTRDDLLGHIYVADFFFVTCPTICPKMTGQMHRVYNEFKDNDDIAFLSHTVMPEADSVPVLKEYTDKLNVKTKKWKFVTGDKKQIYNLARKTYFAAVTEGDGGVNDFIHTENFVLVDKEKRLRGFYDGTSKKDVDRLIEDINALLYEYKEN